MRKDRKNWHPPQYAQADCRAIQALASGEAGPEDQKRALDWIIYQACGTYDEPFRPGEPDAVMYMLGRRSVALAIIKLIKLSHEVFEATDEVRNFKDG